MLKATLLVILLSSGGDYTIEMPSMEECLDIRTTIAEQDPTVKTLCLPIAEEECLDARTTMQEYLSMFLAMINQVKDEEQEEKVIVCDEKPNLDQFLNQLKEPSTTCPQNSPLLRN
jgi:hypothetical protein